MPAEGGRQEPGACFLFLVLNEEHGPPFYTTSSSLVERLNLEP